MMTKFVYFPLTDLVVSRICTAHKESNQPNDPHDPERAAANIGSPSNGDTRWGSRLQPKSANAAEFSCQGAHLTVLGYIPAHISHATSIQTTMGPHIPPQPEAGWSGL
jgi:hypothetical protein